MATAASCVGTSSSSQEWLPAGCGPWAGNPQGIGDLGDRAALVHQAEHPLTWAQAGDSLYHPGGGTSPLLPGRLERGPFFGWRRALRRPTDSSRSLSGCRPVSPGQHASTPAASRRPRRAPWCARERQPGHPDARDDHHGDLEPRPSVEPQSRRPTSVRGPPARGRGGARASPDLWVSATWCPRLVSATWTVSATSTWSEATSTRRRPGVGNVARLT